MILNIFFALPWDPRRKINISWCLMLDQLMHCSVAQLWLMIFFASRGQVP